MTICRCPEYSTCDVCLGRDKALPARAAVGVRVYIAASSRDIERVRWAQQALATVGASLVHDWTQTLSNDERTMNRRDRARLAGECIEGVRSCDLLWMLAPPGPSCGAWAELGIAVQRVERPIIIVSGTVEQRMQSLFTDAPEVSHHTSDNAAVALIAATVRQRRGRCA